MRRIRCTLCPKGCELAEGEIGDCRVRGSDGRRIRSLVYGRPCALHVDPVEKKPLFHFLPGTSILSVGMPGCNLHCKHCQNWRISQAGADAAGGEEVSPEEMVRLAERKGLSAVAYTYTEPLVAYEYVLDCCRAARAAGLRNALVTAAYVNPEPLRELCRHVDAANVDLKAFSDDFYREVCGGRLAPTLKAIETMKAAGVWVEITNLPIPGLNDSPDEIRRLCDWILDRLGAEVPLHFSRFFPQHESKGLSPTPPSTLRRAREIARSAGLRFVYLGNFPDEEGGTTRCSVCGAVCIERRGFGAVRCRLEGGRCPGCGAGLPGIWA